MIMQLVGIVERNYCTLPRDQPRKKKMAQPKPKSGMLLIINLRNLRVRVEDDTTKHRLTCFLLDGPCSIAYLSKFSERTRRNTWSSEKQQTNDG